MSDLISQFVTVFFFFYIYIQLYKYFLLLSDVFLIHLPLWWWWWWCVCGRGVGVLWVTLYKQTGKNKHLECSGISQLRSHRSQLRNPGEHPDVCVLANMSACSCMGVHTPAQCAYECACMCLRACVHMHVCLLVVVILRSSILKSTFFPYLLL